MNILQIENILYKDEDKVIIDDLSFNVSKGDFISIVGESGSGKSTLLRLIGNFISPTKGEIKFFGKNVEEINPLEYKKKVSYCFQTPYLFGDRVMENLEFPYKLRKEKVDMDRISKLLKMVNLSEEILEKENSIISGGEKQRISLIRTLLYKPEILLLDEVTSSLDESNKDYIEEAMGTLNKEGMTIIMVTHDLRQSKLLSNRVITLEKGRIKNLEGK